MRRVSMVCMIVQSTKARGVFSTTDEHGFTQMAAGASTEGNEGFGAAGGELSTLNFKLSTSNEHSSRAGGVADVERRGSPEGSVMVGTAR